MNGKRGLIGYIHQSDAEASVVKIPHWNPKKEYAELVITGMLSGQIVQYCWKISDRAATGEGA